MESNLFWFIEGQNYFSTSWHAKMILTLNKPIWKVLCTNLHTTTSKHLSKLTKHGRCCIQNNQLPTKSMLSQLLFAFSMLILILYSLYIMEDKKSSSNSFKSFCVGVRSVNFLNNKLSLFTKKGYHIPQCKILQIGLQKCIGIALLHSQRSDDINIVFLF